MDTLTSTATKTVSNTKLAIATLALFVAGGAALAAAPLNSMSSAYGWSGCVDPDNVSAVYGPTNPFDQKQLFSKAVTKYNKGSKTDYCYTFSRTGKTYLMEGICNAKGSFATWQKNCAELNLGKTGVNYQCVDGACVNKAASLLPDLVIEGIDFLPDPSSSKLNNFGQIAVYVLNKGQAASPKIDLDAYATTTDKSGLRIVWQEANNKQIKAVDNYLDPIQPNEKKTYIFYMADVSTTSLDHITITVDKFNKVKEIDENNNERIILMKKCTDTDNGQNYNTKGSVTGMTGVGQIVTDTDECLKDGVPAEDVGKLGEYYCWDYYGIGLKTYACPNSCSNGACVATSTQQLPGTY